MIIGLDVGGTHTDVVLLSREGVVDKAKVPTDASNLFKTVLLGLDRISEYTDPGRIERLVLSTTLTTNAVVQQKLEDVGMIVLSGPGLDPLLFKTNGSYVKIKGIVDHRGREIEAVDEDEILRVGREYKSRGIKIIGVVGKFSTRNPSHEIAVCRLLQGQFERIFPGYLISGSLNFPRRIATTFLNAAVYPLHKQFYEAVRASLQEKGLDIPIHLMKADGGTMSVESSLAYPAQTIFSGPAASVMGAIASAPETEDIVVLDIGGTTTDISVLINGVPILRPLGIRLKGYKTLIRGLKTRSIGIGGDSHVRVENSAIVIGPERKGPAMAYGGPVPTPTDALLVLAAEKGGYYDEAAKAIEVVAGEWNKPVAETAQDIFDTACRRILDEITVTMEQINSKPVYTVHELLEGYRINPKKIMILGGPAKEFAYNLEKLSDFSVGVVHSWEVANAIGAALARTTNEVSLFADTQLGYVVLSDEAEKRSIDRDFSIEEAIGMASEALRKQELENGTMPEDLEIEVIERLEFNMVRNFTFAGKNLRVKVQVKPGLLHGYEPL